uniref:Exo-beta-1,3-glucanase, GH17 family n=1 Tax=Candidatus Kentrum sp. TC TaxID=2126339 RepID=A0A450YRR0_9GAMM|nr:MAG: Exo-beta-1,3-glucanase, GH17 family [Candidatus Kentron sp. TC]
MTDKETNKTDSKINPLTTLLSITVGVTVLWKHLNWLSPYLLPSILLGIALYLFYMFVIRNRPQYKHNKYWITVLVISVLSPIALTVNDYLDNSYRIELSEKFEKNMRILRWITYEPTTMNPYAKRHEGLEEIKQELKIIEENGFTGIITFSSKGDLSSIPREAKNIGIKGVIMGIMDPTDEEELERAINESEFVDAYCVGHMFTDYDYGQGEVIYAVEKVRESTNKPITTTLRPNGYLAFPSLTNSIDWFFPDIHTRWYTNASVEKNFRETKYLIEKVSDVQRAYPYKPILLKMISLPSDDAKNASPKEQFMFFRNIVEYSKSDMDFPERVYPSYFSSFDIPWKTPERKWPSGEVHVGLFDKNGKPKKFIDPDSKKEISVISAFDWVDTVQTIE